MQYDPNLPIRGRYLDLRLLVDSCSLPHDQQHFEEGFPGYNELGVPTSKGRLPGHWEWKVVNDVRDGKLSLKDDEYTRPPSEVGDVYSRDNEPCDRATYSPGVDFFISDAARSGMPLKPGQELWVEVTVPESGPPRPIQLAVSDATGFHLLKFN
jgi:hypothetical protein